VIAFAQHQHVRVLLVCADAVDYEGLKFGLVA
jgi:hypothetical protein